MAATTARNNAHPMSYYWSLVKDMDDSFLAIMGCQCTKSGEDARKFEDFAYFCGVFMLLSSKDIVI